jgi:hypothetical protein
VFFVAVFIVAILSGATATVVGIRDWQSDDAIARR